MQDEGSGEESEGADDERAALIKSGSPLELPRMSFLAISTMSYFSVCGGPFGLEVAVSAGGPLSVIIVIVALSLVWALPCALMTAELSSALPSREGYMHWVTRAFGPQWGTLNGWLSLLNSFVDSSTYPAMFCDYLCFALQQWRGAAPLSPLTRWSVSGIVTLTVGAINFRGLPLAAWASIWLASLSMLPFVLMVPLVLARPLPSFQSMQPPAGGIDWLALLSMAMWVTSGFEAVSLFSVQVARPSHTLPKALRFSLYMMIVTTVGPILLCAAVPPAASWRSWRVGAFSQSAERLGGPLLGMCMCFAAMASTLGMLNAIMCTSARAMQALAHQQMLPALFRLESDVTGTPLPALLATMLGILCLLSFSFKELVEMDMSFCAIAIAMEFFALLRLRWSEPLLHRPYRVPLGHWALWLFCSLPLSICTMIITLSLTKRSFLVWLGAIATWGIMSLLKQRGRHAGYTRVA